MAQWGLAKDFRATGLTQNIPFVHRQLPHGDLYFLVNPGTTPLVFDGHFRVTGKAPEIWDAVTGSKRPASYRQEASETVMPLNLAAEQSLFVLFRHDTTRSARTVSSPLSFAEQASKARGRFRSRPALVPRRALRCRISRASRLYKTSGYAIFRERRDTARNSASHRAWRGKPRISGWT
jgi:hypothetical protein